VALFCLLFNGQPDMSRMFFSWFWRQLTAKAILDIWVLVLVAILLLAYVVATARRINTLTSRVASYERSSLPARKNKNAIKLDERELEALKQHADLQPNYGMTASSLAEDISVHKQEAQYVLDALNDRGSSNMYSRPTMAMMLIN
jgi:hypothetical protein